MSSSELTRLVAVPNLRAQVNCILLDPWALMAFTPNPLYTEYSDFDQRNGQCKYRQRVSRAPKVTKLVAFMQRPAFSKVTGPFLCTHVECRAELHKDIWLIIRLLNHQKSITILVPAMFNMQWCPYHTATAELWINIQVQEGMLNIDIHNTCCVTIIVFQLPRREECQTWWMAQ